MTNFFPYAITSTRYICILNNSEVFCNISLFPRSFSEKTTTFSPLISKALKYANDNLRSITKIEAIAAHLFVSQSYLFRLFQRELHQTPKIHYGKTPSSEKGNSSHRFLSGADFVIIPRFIGIILLFRPFTLRKGNAEQEKGKVQPPSRA